MAVTSNMEFSKNFCRLVTINELEDQEVIEFFDIVQSVVPTKMVVAYTDDDKVSVDVTAYESRDGRNVYEIVLEDNIDLEEGERISDILMEEFEHDFDFETSMEI